jgi:hypothetical protein
MTSPKLHHYVPRFYLRRFAVENDRFWVWDKHTGKVFETTPYSVAAEKHFYGAPNLIGTKHDPLIIERQLSELEGNASRITSVWIDTFDLLEPRDRFPLSLDDRRQMSLFISVQLLRTAGERDILTRFLANRGHYNTRISSSETKKQHLQMLRRSGLVETIAEWINQAIWIIARNDSATPFWTSDNPVALKRQDHRMWLKAGIMGLGSYVVFPISPRYILYCKEPTHWAKLKKFDCCLSPVEITSEMVQHENSGQVFMASRFVISSTKDFSFATEFAKTIGTDFHAPDNS